MSAIVNAIGRSKAAKAVLAAMLAVAACLSLSSAPTEKAYAGVSGSVSGNCEIVECLNPGPTDDDYNVFSIRMPDGQMKTGYCLDHGNAAPVNGVYGFNGTWNGSGYDVVINSDGYDNAATAAPLPCQRVGDFTWTPMGKIELLKVSANPDVTEGNPCYSLKGAVYGVYNSHEEAVANSNAVTYLTTNEDGWALSADLNVGTYYVKEVTASTGYALDENVYTADVNWSAYAHPYGGDAVDGKLPEQPQNDPAIMWVGKIDAETTDDMPQGSASLAGAQYTIKYYAGNFNQDNLPVNATRTWVVSTDADGKAMLEESYKVSGDDFYKTAGGNVSIPLGTITIQETKAPEGYLLGDQPLYVQRITSEGVIPTVNTYNAPKDPEQVMRGGVAIQKHDSQTAGTPQGDASLAGIEFTIYNQSDGPVVVDGVSYAKGEAVKTIVTGDDGRAATGDHDLPYGDYSVKETATNGSMLNTSKEQSFKVSADGQVVELQDSFTDDVARGNVTLAKLDKESGDNWEIDAGNADKPQADLGATFAIANKSANPVVVQGTTFQPGETVYTGKAEKTADGWRLDTPARLLPYGTYEVTETAPGTGYVKSDQAIKFEIREDGKTVDLGANTFENQIVRADLKFQKKDESTGNLMAGVPFVLVSYTVDNDGTEHEVEAHLLVTDKNGMADTSARENANALDAAFSGSLEDGYKVNEAKLAELLKAQGGQDSGKRTGIWFGKTHDGGITAADGSLGALPYGTYKLIELPCEANEGRQTIEADLTVARSDNTATLDYGTLDNLQPEIHTNAYDGTSGNPYDNEIVADDEACVIDRVTYQDLVPGRTYELTAELHDAATGAAIAIDGQTVSKTMQFTPTNKNGFVEVRLAFDGAKLADGQKAVVFEKLTWNGQAIASHEDRGDAEQTVTPRVPSIGTTLKSSDGSKTVKLDPETKLVDTVGYKNLREGAEYELKMELVHKADGSPVLDKDGNAVTAVKKFKPEEARGTVDVEATFDGTELADGDGIVAFETLTKVSTGKTTAEHKDLGDEGQTVETAKPAIATTATDKVSGTHSVATDDKATVTDKVEHWNLTADGRSYTLTATLMKKSSDENGNLTAEPLLDKDGNEVKAVKQFTPDTPHGFVEVELAFDSLSLDDGTELVVYEELERNGSDVAEHKDPADEGQTVTVEKPSIGTKASDGLDGDKNVVSNSKVTVADDVEYTGLVPGKEYTLKGKLVLKGADEEGDATAEPVLGKDGKEVTAETKFTPDHEHGTARVTFEFDGSELPHGAEIVAFESLERAGVEIAVHADVNDEGQTVTVLNPKLATSASDAADGDKTVVADAEAELVDTVSHENLSAGSKYTLIGVVMDRGTGLPLDTAAASDAETAKVKAFWDEFLAGLGTDAASLEEHAKACREAAEGEEPALKVGTADWEALQEALAKNMGTASGLVISQQAYTPERADGATEATFKFDASKWVKAGEPVDCVVYEFLVHDGKLVAVHADGEDASQQFEVAPSEIRTTAFDKTDKDQIALPSKDCVIVDSVIYTNLIPGKEYKVSGKLMDKATGKPLMVADKEVTAEKTFTPNTPNGTVELEFAFDSSNLDGKVLVAFEKLTKDGTEVAVHEDIEDKNQTVEIDKLNGAKGKVYEKTGLDLGKYAWAIALAAVAGAALIVGGAVAWKRSRKGKGAEGGLFGDE